MDGVTAGRISGPGETAGTGSEDAAAGISALFHELSVPGGHVAREFPGGAGPICQILSVAANGQHVLLRCPGFARLDNGRVTPLPRIGGGAAAAW